MNEENVGKFVLKVDYILALNNSGLSKEKSYFKKQVIFCDDFVSHFTLNFSDEKE